MIQIQTSAYAARNKRRLSELSPEERITRKIQRAAETGMDLVRVDLPDDISDSRRQNIISDLRTKGFDLKVDWEGVDGRIIIEWSNKQSD